MGGLAFLLFQFHPVLGEIDVDALNKVHKYPRPDPSSSQFCFQTS